MHLVYIDEVKCQLPYQKYHWLCGLAIPSDTIKSVESALDAIADDYFASRALDRSTEFHAADIVHGKGPYSGRDLAGRLALIKKLACVVEEHPSIGRIQVRLDPELISRTDYQRIAFMFMVERVDQLMAARNSLGLLIVDHDREFSNENVRNLSAFKAFGTDFAFGQEVTHVVDTVHQTHSHHSRLLQLADVYTYAVCLSANSPTSYVKKTFVAHVRQLNPFLFPDKYKCWPPEI